MVSKDTMNRFLGKFVFVKIKDDRVQVGTLEKYGDDYFLRGKSSEIAIDNTEVARISTEEMD